MRTSKRVLIIGASASLIFLVNLFLLRHQYINPTQILLLILLISIMLFAIMTTKAFKDQTLLEKNFYTNTLGAAIHISLYSFVMWIVWLIFKGDNVLFKAVIISYPLIKGVDTFVINKFQNFKQIFSYYNNMQSNLNSAMKTEKKVEKLNETNNED